MRAYEGREAVLLKLLETKALIKAKADSTNRNAVELPVSLRNSPGLAGAAGGRRPGGEGNVGGDGHDAGEPRKVVPQTPVSVLTAPTIVEYPTNQASPASMVSSKETTVSPSAGTLNTLNTNALSKKKKKKGIFGGFFGGKKRDKRGNFPASRGRLSGRTCRRERASQRR